MPITDHERLELSQLRLIARLAVACRQAQKAFYANSAGNATTRQTFLIKAKAAEKELDKALGEKSKGQGVLEENAN